MRSHFSAPSSQLNSDNQISQFIVRTQLVIPYLIMLPLLAMASASCNVDRSKIDGVTTIASQSQTPSLDRQGGAQLTFQLKPTQQHPQISDADRTSVLRVIESRVNGLGVKGAYVKSLDNNRVLVQLPGVKNSQQAQRILGGTARLEFRKQKIGTEGKLSAELDLLQKIKAKRAILKQSKSPDKSAILANQVEIEQQYTEIGKLFDRAALTGGNLRDVRAQPVSSQGWEIALEFDDIGREAFTNLTKNLAGTGRSIGVFIDNDPISTPTVGAVFADNGITGGKAVITGNFTTETATELAIQLRGGSLPVPVEVIENRTIPPK